MAASSQPPITSPKNSAGAVPPERAVVMLPWSHTLTEDFLSVTPGFLWSQLCNASAYARDPTEAFCCFLLGMTAYGPPSLSSSVTWLADPDFRLHALNMPPPATALVAATAFKKSLRVSAGRWLEPVGSMSSPPLWAAEESPIHGRAPQ